MTEQEKFIPKEAKQEIWDKLSQEVEDIADRLGHPIDEGIKDTVVAFKAYEFPTRASCEGHVEGKHGLPHPWIDIETAEPENWKDNEEVQKEWRKENLLEQRKMMHLLEEFYQGREIPIDARLVFERHGIFGAFRIQSMGADTMDLLSAEELAERSNLYKKEMEDFTNFLKVKFFS